MKGIKREKGEEHCNSGHVGCVGVRKIRRKKLKFMFGQDSAEYLAHYRHYTDVYNTEELTDAQLCFLRSFA
jgi:hypothetical protein